MSVLCSDVASDNPRQQSADSAYSGNKAFVVVAVDERTVVVEENHLDGVKCSVRSAARWMTAW